MPICQGSPLIRIEIHLVQNPACGHTAIGFVNRRQLCEILVRDAVSTIVLDKVVAELHADFGIGACAPTDCMVRATARTAAIVEVDLRVHVVRTERADKAVWWVTVVWG